MRFTPQSNTTNYKDKSRHTAVYALELTAFQVILANEPYCNLEHHSIWPTLLP
jgi:hypothetical protein